MLKFYNTLSRAKEDFDAAKGQGCEYLYLRTDGL